MVEKPPWATCLFSDILLSYLDEIGSGEKAIDYSALFSGIEGFEAPSDPKRFLRDVSNWAPLRVPPRPSLAMREGFGEKGLCLPCRASLF